MELKDNASSGLSSIGGSLKTLGGIGLGIAAGGVAAFGSALVAGIGDAREAAQLMAQTEAVIRSTGNAAGFSAQQIADMASSLSAAAGKSLFGDDQIQAGENLLLTFTNIKETLPDATKIMVDMAQAMGTDVKGGAIQLGKALNDPIAGISALSRVGVTFTDAQKKVIKTLQASGDIAGAQKVILAELNKEFGGSAQAAADADGGWAQFKDRMGEAAETAGTALLPVLSILTGFLGNTVAPIIESAAQGFASLVAAFQTGAEGGDFLGGLINALYSLDSVSPIFTTIGDSIVSLAQSFSEGGIGGLLNDFVYQLTGIEGAAFAVMDVLAPFIATFTDAATPIEGFIAVLSQISPAFALIAGVVQEVLPQVLTIVQTVFGDVAAYFQANGAEMLASAQTTWTSIHDTVLSLIEPLAAVVSAILAQILAFWQANGADIMAFVGTTWTQINAIIQVAMALIQATIIPVLTFIAGFITSHSAEIQKILGDAWTVIKNVIDIALTLIKGVITAALQIVQGDWSGAWETIKTMSGKIVTDLWNILKAGFETILTLIGTTTDEFVGNIMAMPARIAGIGAAIIDGIIDGIKGASGRLFSTLKNLADDALQSAKDALGISSPSRAFAEVGQEMIGGMLVGLADMLPDLMFAVSDMSKDLIDQVASLGDSVRENLADAFDATATIDRTAARNIDAVRKLAGDMQAGVQEALDAAMAQAQTMQDPAEAQAFFKMRSSQIIELAKLQQDLDAARASGNVDQTYDLERQMALIQAAQAAEQSAATTRQGGQSATEALQAQIAALMANEELANVAGLGAILTQLAAFANQGSATAGGVVLPPPPPLDPNAGFVGPGAPGGGVVLQAGALVVQVQNATDAEAKRFAGAVIAEIDRRRGGRG